MKEIKRQTFIGERALFNEKDLNILESTFMDGESPLKESENISLDGCSFKWKYPVWYSKNVAIKNSTLFETARAGIWYTQNIKVCDSIIEAPKTFRRSKNITLLNVTMSNAEETLWNCENVDIKNVSAKGNYLAMNSEGVTCENLNLVGDYPFDGAKKVTIKNSRLISKDAFWNSEDITVIDSYICGEYLGWNAKNLTLINCTIESLQGFCYIKNLVLKGCKLINTTLAFEYSTVDADIIGGVDSIKNPIGGKICADFFGKIIMQEDKVDVDKTIILCRAKDCEQKKGSCRSCPSSILF
jgi:hypothetical protein